MGPEPSVSWKPPCVWCGSGREVTLPHRQKKTDHAPSVGRPAVALCGGVISSCRAAQKNRGGRGESEEVATAVKAAFLVMFYTLKGSNDSYFNESLEVAELKYQQALKRLKRAYPGSAFFLWLGPVFGPRWSNPDRKQ